MRVAFCGHRELEQPERVREWLRQVTERLIGAGADCFLLGGYGEFDQLAAAVLREQKVRWPQIERVLVLAYLDQRQDGDGYDATVYPPLEGVPRRLAILRRNRWMVERADLLVAWVRHDWGGAAKTLRIAEQQKKKIIRYPEVR